MRKAALVIALLAAAAASAFGAELLAAAAVDWTPGLRIGVEYTAASRLGLKADVGFSLLGAPMGDLFATLRLAPAAGRFRLNLLLGLPMRVGPYGCEGFAAAFGASTVVGWWFTPRLGVDLRLGAGLLMVLAEGEVTVGGDEPFAFWPDAAVGLVWRLR